MISFAHIVNPVAKEPDEELAVAQPITFATMAAAKEFSQGQAQVHHYAVQIENEDRVALPQSFEQLPDLTRTITDIKPFQEKRALPLIKDILDRLYSHSSADYLIYTNVDIALLPFFYLTIVKIIQQGYDAFVINRRTIPGYYRHVRDLPLMYAEIGEHHKGWDCFVFDRSLYSRFELANACIGAGWIGRILITNMACLAGKFRVFKDLHLTFHIGNEKAWQQSRFTDYIEHNKSECKKILLEFDGKYGPLDRAQLPGRFFLNL